MFNPVNSLASYDETHENRSIIDILHDREPIKKIADSFTKPDQFVGTHDMLINCLMQSQQKQLYNTKSKLLLLMICHK